MFHATSCYPLGLAVCVEKTKKLVHPLGEHDGGLTFFKTVCMLGIFRVLGQAACNIVTEHLKKILSIGT